MKKNKTRRLVVALLLLSILTPLHVQAGSNTSDYKSFVDEVGEFLYFLAWPTATYERVSFSGVSAVTDGVDVKVRLHGKSTFSDGHLWTDVVLEIRGGEIRDLRWGRNNAILAQPGSTITALGEVIAELNAQYEQSQISSGSSTSNRPAPSNTVYGYHFTNNCKHPLRLAIRYNVQGDRWVTTGWWNFKPGQSSYLASDQQRLRATNSIWYYYAETTDRSNWEWSGGVPTYLDGTKLMMKKVEDHEGDNNWTAVCN